MTHRDRPRLSLRSLSPAALASVRGGVQGSSLPTESVSLNFTKMTTVWTPTDPDHQQSIELISISFGPGRG